MLRKTTLLVFLLLLSLSHESFAKTFNVAIIKTKDAFSYNETTIGYKHYIKRSRKYLDKERIRIKLKEYNVKDDEETTRDLIKEIKTKRYDIVVTFGRRAFESVKDEIKETPIIFATMFNPYNGEGTPGEEYQNITGIKMDIPTSVQFESLKSFVPYLERVGVIYTEAYNDNDMIKKAEKAADELGLILKKYIVSGESEVASALEKVIDETDALWMVPDYDVYSEEVFKYVVQKTIENEFPLMGLSKAYVKAGALFAVSWDFQDIGRQAAIMSYGIIKGETFEEGKIKPLRKFPVVINKRTAESIDLRIPQWVSENTIEFYE